MSSTSSGSYSILSGYSTGNSAIAFKIHKQKYVEAITASTTNNMIYAYHYGNDSAKDAYVDIREGVNELVSTD